MPFRSLTSNAIELQKLADAFDAAWIAVNRPSPIDEAARTKERARLSHIIMGIWQRDPNGDLAEAAVEAFGQGSPSAGGRRQGADGDEEDGTRTKPGIG